MTEIVLFLAAFIFVVDLYLRYNKFTEVTYWENKADELRSERDFYCKLYHEYSDKYFYCKNDYLDLKSQIQPESIVEETEEKERIPIDFYAISFFEHSSKEITKKERELRMSTYEYVKMRREEELVSPEYRLDFLYPK